MEIKIMMEKLIMMVREKSKYSKTIVTKYHLTAVFTFKDCVAICL